mmetsp:Transcript_23653/g.35064  ORF Transcript_23653/g.35064 Transcript_23653/m.35064 type:complete len:616 (-) Transcript_23653:149-1996(-)
MMNFQSPPSTRGSLSSMSNGRKSPNMEEKRNFVALVAPSSLRNTYSSDHNMNFQIQRQMSVTELDRIQRARREEAERCNAQLQSSSVMDKLRNAKEIQSLPSIGNMETCLPFQSNCFDDDIDLIDDNVGLSFDQDDVPMRKSLFRERPRKTLAPKLRLRPHRDVFPSREEPVIIPGDASEDKFGDLFPSPHSNKFVLQFPDDPTQELTLNTSVKEEDEGYESVFQDNENKSEGSISSQADETLEHFLQTSFLPGTFVCNNSENGTPSETFGSYFMRPIRSNGSLPVEQRNTNRSSPSPSDSSTDSIPNPVERTQYPKKKVILKPKKRRTYSHYEISGGDSPRSTSSSNLENEPGLALPVPVKTQALSCGRTLDEMANDMNLNGNGNGYATAVRPVATKHTSESAFLPLRPKRQRITSMTTKSLYSDECGDEVMELDPNMSQSRDMDNSFDGNQDSNVHSQDFTPHHYRCLSVSISDDCDHAARSRTQSTTSIKEQIEMAREAAARFVGSNTYTFMSPSELSESNFRTPNSEAVCKRNVHPNQGGSNIKSSEKNGMFIPKLNASASEDEYHAFIKDQQSTPSGSGDANDVQNARPRSNSFFGMMKIAFSPPAMPWK